MKILFIVFFIFSIIFLNQVGIFGAMREDSFLIAAASIVENNTFSTNKYYYMTTDRSFFEGNYYSDKEPGLYVISTFIYNFIDRFFHEDLDLNIGDLKVLPSKILAYMFTPQKMIIAKFILPVFTSTIFTILTSFLIFKISLRILKDYKKSILISIIYFFSLPFHYSIVYNAHPLPTFLILLSLYLIIFYDKKFLNLSVLLFSFSNFFSALSFSLTVFFYAYVLFYYRDFKTLIYLLLGILPLLVFNYSVFETPFTLPRFHLDKSIWNLPGYNGIMLDLNFILNSLWRILIDPYKGLFFYYPIFLLSLLSIIKIEKKISILLFGLLILDFLATSSWWAWWHAGPFGIQLLLPSVAILSVLLIFTFKYYKEAFLVSLLFLPLLFFTTFIGLVGGYEDMLKDLKTSWFKKEYEEIFYSWKPFPNILKDEYLRRFINEGPHSFTLQYLIFRENLLKKEYTETENLINFKNLFWIMNDSAIVKFYSSEEKISRFYFDIYAVKLSSLEFYFNGELKNKFFVFASDKPLKSAEVKIEKGYNIILLKTDERCFPVNESLCINFVIKGIYEK